MKMLKGKKYAKCISQQHQKLTVFIFKIFLTKSPKKLIKELKHDKNKKVILSLEMLKDTKNKNQQF